MLQMLRFVLVQRSTLLKFLHLSRISYVKSATPCGEMWNRSDFFIEKLQLMSSMQFLDQIGPSPDMFDIPS